MCTYFENRYYHAKMTENKNRFSGQSFLHPTLFLKIIYQIFCNSFGSYPLQFPDQLPYDFLNLGLEILPVLQRIFTYFWKTAIKTMNLLSSALEQLTVV